MFVLCVDQFYHHFVVIVGRLGVVDFFAIFVLVIAVLNTLLREETVRFGHLLGEQARRIRFQQLKIN